MSRRVTHPTTHDAASTPGHRRTSRLVGIAAAVALATGTLVGLTHGAGTASADGEYPLSQCFGPSPNIVDTPYMPNRIFVGSYQGTNWVTVTYGSLWIGVGYDSTAWLEWQQGNKRGTKVSHSRVVPPNTGVHTFVFTPGEAAPGAVKVTLRSVNRNALWSIPATSCSGTLVLS